MKKRTTALAALCAAIPLVLAPTAANAIACAGDFSEAVGTFTSITREEFMTRVCSAQLRPGSDPQDVHELKEVIVPDAISGLDGLEQLYERVTPALDRAIEKCYTPDDYCTPEAVGRATGCLRDELPGMAMTALGPDALASGCEALRAVAATDPQELRDRARNAGETYASYLRSQRD